MNEEMNKDCLDLENNSKCCFFKVANAFLLLANFILIVFASAYLPTQSLNVDYTAITVAVFGILITVLIGWQIYNAMNVENRISKAEKQLSDMILKVKETEDRIHHSSESAEKYSTAINCMGCALANYYQIRLDRDKGAKAKARELCISYNMAVRSITYFLESEKKPSLIIPWIQSCVNIMEQCLKELSKELYSSVTGYAPLKMIERCDTAHRTILRYVDLFDAAFIDRITAYRNKRQELLKDKYELP